MSRIEVRASGPWRAVEILGGIIVIALAIIALADSQFTTQTLVIVIAAGLIIGGLFRISVGTFATVLPSPLRSLNITGGSSPSSSESRLYSICKPQWLLSSEFSP